MRQDNKKTKMFPDSHKNLLWTYFQVHYKKIHIAQNKIASK